MRSNVPPDLRASDLDRERVVEVLKRNYAEGRLGQGELTERVDAAYRAVRVRQLDALTADLPGTMRARARRGPDRLTMVLMAVAVVVFLSVVPVEGWLPFVLYGGAMLMVLLVLVSPILIPVLLIAWIVHKVCGSSSPRDRDWR